MDELTQQQIDDFPDFMESLCSLPDNRPDLGMADTRYALLVTGVISILASVGIVCGVVWLVEAVGRLWGRL